MKRWELPAWVSVALLVGVSILLYAIRGVLPPFVVAAALAYMLLPLVVFLEGYFRLSRGKAVLLLYLVVLTPLSITWFWVLPSLVYESQALTGNFTDIVGKALAYLFGSQALPLPGVAVPASAVSTWAVSGAQGVLGIPAESALVPQAAFSALVNGLLAAVVLAYLLVDGERLVRAVLGLLSPERRLRVRFVVDQVNQAVFTYIWAQFALTGLMLGVTWLVFGSLYRLPYALAVAAAVVLLGLVPFFGPAVSTLFAAAVGLAIGGERLAVMVAVCYPVLRLVEQVLIAPHLLDRTYVLRPAVAIFAFVGGAAIAGLLGALLALPLAVVAKATLIHWQSAGQELQEAAGSDLSYGTR